MTNIPPKHIVLYADDDPDDRALVQEAFEKYAENVEVITATDGYEALSYLNGLEPFEPAPCLIILDINMPRMNGKEALQKIRTMDGLEDIPVVLFTTSSFPLDKDFATKHAAGFITKPLDSRQVKAIAEQFVSHCAAGVKKSIQRRRYR